MRACRSVGRGGAKPRHGVYGRRSRSWLRSQYRNRRPRAAPMRLCSLPPTSANRAELAAQRDPANKALAELKIEKAKVQGDKKVAEADLGPVRYLATLLGAGNQTCSRISSSWFRCCSIRRRCCCCSRRRGDDRSRPSRPSWRRCSWDGIDGSPRRQGVHQFVL
jgi:hypothetical protein